MVNKIAIIVRYLDNDKLITRSGGSFWYENEKDIEKGFNRIKEFVKEEVKTVK